MALGVCRGTHFRRFGVGFGVQDELCVWSCLGPSLVSGYVAVVPAGGMPRLARGIARIRAFRDSMTLFVGGMEPTAHLADQDDPNEKRHTFRPMTGIFVSVSSSYGGSVGVVAAHGRIVGAREPDIREPETGER